MRRKVWRIERGSDISLDGSKSDLCLKGTGELRGSSRSGTN